MVTGFTEPPFCQVEDEPLPVLRRGRLDVGAVLRLAELRIASFLTEERGVRDVQRGGAIFVGIPSRI